MPYVDETGLVCQRYQIVPATEFLTWIAATGYRETSWPERRGLGQQGRFHN
jgi:hypothetical protein